MGGREGREGRRDGGNRYRGEGGRGHAYIDICIHNTYSAE